VADENSIQRIPDHQLRQEDGARELATSPEIKPYPEFIRAVMLDHDQSPELEAMFLVALVTRSGGPRYDAIFSSFVSPDLRCHYMYGRRDVDFRFVPIPAVRANQQLLFNRPNLAPRKGFHGVSLQRVIGDVLHDFLQLFACCNVLLVLRHH
jgi:hypothetical protein